LKTETGRARSHRKAVADEVSNAKGELNDANPTAGRHSFRIVGRYEKTSK